MKKFLFRIWYVIVIFVISGCTQESLNYEYDNHKEISTFEVVDIADVPGRLLKGEIGYSSLVTTLDALQELGISQVLRYNKEQYYSITPLSDGSYLLILFKMSQFEANGVEKKILYVADSCLVSSVEECGDAYAEIGNKTEEEGIFTYLLPNDLSEITEYKTD